MSLTKQYGWSVHSDANCKIARQLENFSFVTATIKKYSFARLYPDKNGTPAKVLSAILNGNIKILYDNRIIFEYIDVLSRQEFGFAAETVYDMIDYFKHDGEFINADYLKTNFTDETDKKFYEVFKSGKAQYLITGNKRHFPKEDAVIIPKEFLDEIQK